MVTYYCFIVYPRPTFGVKLNFADDSGGPSYGKPPLRGPPVQGLHESATPYSQGSSTPIFSGMCTCSR